MVTTLKVSSEQEKFVLLAIETLRTDRSKGIHTVFSGFNDAFRQHFVGADPVATVQALEAKGVIQTRRSKKGSMMYLTGEFPKAAANGTKGKTALAAIMAKL